MEVKVFDQQGFYTEIHNALLDVVLPAVPPNAWKILCVIARQTKGWQRKTVRLNVHQIMRLAGIKSEHTAQDALDALRDFQQLGKSRPLIVESQPDKWSARSFGLNRDVRLRWFPVAESATEPVAFSATEPVAFSATEPVAFSATEPVALSATHVRKEETILTEESSSSKKKKRKVAAAAANSHVSIHDHETILEWITETRKGIENPGGLAVTIARDKKNDAEIKTWLEKKLRHTAKQERISEKERIEAEQTRLELEAWQARETARESFLRSLSEAEYDRRSFEAAKSIKAQLRPDQRLYFDSVMQVESVEYRMFVIYESECEAGENAKAA